MPVSLSLLSTCATRARDSPEAGCCELCRGPLRHVARPLRALVGLGDPLERLLRTVGLEDVALNANKKQKEKGASVRLFHSVGLGGCKKKAWTKKSARTCYGGGIHHK